MNNHNRILVDLLPSLLFYITFIATNMYIATTVLMVASVVVVYMNKVIYKKSSMFLYFSSGAVLLFGGLTLFSGDTKFIKMKPTFVYLTLSTILLLDQFYKNSKIRNFLIKLLPISDSNMKDITKLLAIFWFVLAGLNEIVWRNFDDHTWMLYKTFGLMILNAVFFTFVYITKLKRV